MNNNSVWPGWETVEMIGRGSFGTVYEIQRDVLGDVEKAALKVISIPQNSGDIEEMHNDGYDDESITSTFQRHLKSIVAEYSLMRKMSGSANIVNCDDIRYIQHTDGLGWDIFIKMELLTPLAKALPADISEEMVVKAAKDLCAALELCKHHGIVHRDIKPQNIFLSPNGDYKLGDFGIAKTVEKTMGGTKIGTYKYMAPEVYNNQPYGATADIYSLGLVLYWMLNEKRMPFLPLPPAKPGADMEAEARLRRFNGEQLPPPAHGSKQLQKIVLKACAFDPKNRYQSAADMLHDLSNGFVSASDPHEAVEEEKTKQCTPPSEPTIPVMVQTQNQPPRKRIPLLPALVVCFSALALLIALTGNRNKKSSTPAANSSITKTQTVTSAHVHTWKNATCTDPKTCSGCGETSGSELGHQWIDATYNEPKSCRVCKATEGTVKSPTNQLSFRNIVSHYNQSSFYDDDYLEPHTAERLYDNDLKTNWTEGKPGYGEGEYAIIYLKGTYAVKELQICIGSQFDDAHYWANGRPSIVTLSFSDGQETSLELEDTKDWQNIILDRFYYTDSIMITIDKVYKGSEYQDTVIAEVNFTVYPA